MNFLGFLAEISHGLWSAIGFIISLCILLWLVDKIWTRIDTGRRSYAPKRTARSEYRSGWRR